MGATLSKLWGSVKATFTSRSSSGDGSNNNANKKASDLENGIADAPVDSKTEAMSGLKKYEVTEPWLKYDCALGEAPFWEEATNTLRFFDIEKQEFHRIDVAVGPSSHRIVQKLDISVGCTADIDGNEKEFVFGGKFGYGVANKETGEYRWIKKVWDEEEIQNKKPERMRGNDGAVDSQGRFWVGYMNDPLVTKVIDEGAVFRLDPDLSLHRQLSNITIPNGTTWNQSDDTLFWADSLSGTISKFDYDPSTGNISNQRPFFSIPQDIYGKDAVPDGHCIDEEGFMWTAVHGAGVVLRISPEGQLVAEIKLPTQQPTCPCFVGEDLVITSAGGTSGKDGKGVDEFAGSLFKIHVGVKGLKRFKFKGGAEVEGGKVDGKVVAE